MDSNWDEVRNLCHILTNAPTTIHRDELQFFKDFLLKFRVPDEESDDEDAPPEPDDHVVKSSLEMPTSPNALALARRAKEYLTAGRLGEAMTDCESALALNPDSARALAIRAQIYAKRGNWSQCNADLSKAQAIDYNEDLDELHKSSIRNCCEVNKSMPNVAPGIQNLFGNGNMPPNILSEAQEILHDPAKLNTLLQNPMFKQMMQQRA